MLDELLLQTLPFLTKIDKETLEQNLSSEQYSSKIALANAQCSFHIHTKPIEQSLLRQLFNQHLPLEVYIFSPTISNNGKKTSALVFTIGKQQFLVNHTTIAKMSCPKESSNVTKVKSSIKLPYAAIYWDTVLMLIWLTPTACLDNTITSAINDGRDYLFGTAGGNELHEKKDYLSSTSRQLLLSAIKLMSEELKPVLTHARIFKRILQVPCSAVSISNQIDHWTSLLDRLLLWVRPVRIAPKLPSQLFEVPTPQENSIHEYLKNGVERTIRNQIIIRSGVETFKNSTSYTPLSSRTPVTSLKRGRYEDIVHNYLSAISLTVEQGELLEQEQQLKLRDCESKVMAQLNDFYDKKISVSICSHALTSDDQSNLKRFRCSEENSGTACNPTKCREACVNSSMFLSLLAASAAAENLMAVMIAPRTDLYLPYSLTLPANL